jgi:predicted Fe-Mo cluster-binding NifX family protein
MLALHLQGEHMKKVAFPSDDGKTISRHLGQARYYYVYTLDSGTAPQVERRDKLAHGSEHDHDHHNHEHHNHEAKHTSMFQPITDCQVLISGGMGRPAYDRLTQMGIEVVMADEKEIDKALAAYQSGALSTDIRRVHAHHDHHH